MGRLTDRPGPDDPHRLWVGIVSGIVLAVPMWVALWFLARWLF